MSGGVHGLAAGQDDDRVAEGLDVIEELVRVLGRELARVGTVSGRGTAVYAVQDAAAGHLPGDQPGEIFFWRQGWPWPWGAFMVWGWGMKTPYIICSTFRNHRSDQYRMTKYQGEDRHFSFDK